MYGHDASASLFLYFRHTVLSNGDFKAGVIRQPGSGAVVHSVSQNPGAIGYVGLNFVSDFSDQSIKTSRFVCQHAPPQAFCAPNARP
jgi:ABC-type phosphate transport system substrate-binding protein